MSKKRDLNTGDFIGNVDKVAAKLACEGLTKKNYTIEKAKAILAKTVAAVFCTRVLFMYEDEIITLLPSNDRETPNDTESLAAPWYARL